MSAVVSYLAVAVMIAGPALLLAIVLETIIGFPILGGTLPWITRRRLALNRDGTYVDTGKTLIEDEVGFYYIEVWSFEWLGFGLPLSSDYVRLTSTGEIVEDPDFEVAGG
jgi:hypothetical protein